jgi:hydrogenase maturation protease
MTHGSAAARARVVVIGIGNEFRRDDGVGPEVLSRLRAQAADPVQAAEPGQAGREPAGAALADAVQLVSSDGEPASLIEAWAGASLAVVVDAVLADPPNPGRLHRLVLDRPASADARHVSSHGLGLSEAIGLARALDRMPDRLIVHAVEAADVGHGVGFTPAVAAAVAPLTAAVLRDLAGPDPLGPGQA